MTTTRALPARPAGGAGGAGGAHGWPRDRLAACGSGWFRRRASTTVDAAADVGPDGPEALLELAARAAPAQPRHLVDRVVVDHLPVARALAARSRDRGEPLDDLVQVACLALVRAAQGCEPGRGRGFLP